ncbi:MAG: hypothetical protein FJ279_06495 [Planctomycetes bacterium]|nr:hypothetical protein [Planctomycetota bacterium]MBM4082153.1 hypothetical protein [Planctomycetota bacterium]
MDDDTNDIRRRVEEKLAARRDEQEIERFLARGRQPLFLACFSFALGLILFFGPFIRDTGPNSIAFALCGLFFIAIGQAHFLAYRQARVLRALVNQLREIEARMTSAQEQTGGNSKLQAPNSK